MKRKTKRPVRYKHPVAKGMLVQSTNMNDAHDTGTVLEFNYGNRQKKGQVGGWKNDPRPSLLIFHDDGSKYLEGVNLNYLSYYYVKKLQALLKRFPGITGEELYLVVSKSASYALKKGYRKYLRPSVKSPHKLVMGESIEHLRDELGRFTGEYRVIGIKE